MPREYKRYTHTEQTDKLIRIAYENYQYRSRKNPAVRKVCELLRWPKHIVYRRALTLGCVHEPNNKTRWTESEMILLEQYGHLTPCSISRIFKKKGYNRTPSAISIRQNRYLGSRIDAYIDAGILSANSAAICLGVDNRTVCRWIHNGWLIAKRRGTDRAENIDIFEITEKNLKQFVLDYRGHINLAKVNKEWFIDLLAYAK